MWVGVQRHCLAGSPLRCGVVAEPVVCRSEMGERVQPCTHVIVPCTCERHIERGNRLVIAPLEQGDVPKLGPHRAEVRILVGASARIQSRAFEVTQLEGSRRGVPVEVRVVAVQCERPIERGERTLRELVRLGSVGGDAGHVAEQAAQVRVVVRVRRHERDSALKGSECAMEPRATLVRAGAVLRGVLCGPAQPYVVQFPGRITRQGSFERGHGEVPHAACRLTFISRNLCSEFAAVAAELTRLVRQHDAVPHESEREAPQHALDNEVDAAYAVLYPDLRRGPTMGLRPLFEPREAERREPEGDEDKRAGHQAVLVEVLHDGNAPEDGRHDEREHVHAARVGFRTVCRCLAETRQDST